jgi:hypothetical protein
MSAPDDGGAGEGGEAGTAKRPVSLVEFCARHGTGIMTMRIDADVSPFPRTIRIPSCPRCGGALYLSHRNFRADPNIEAKRQAGPIKDKVPPDNLWLSSCWTADCDFFIAFGEADLLACPECGRRCMEGYTLYDHMRYQCTDKASHPDSLRAAGVEDYMEVALLGGGDDGEQQQ